MTNQASRDFIPVQPMENPSAQSSSLGSVLLTSALLLLSVALAVVLGIMGIFLAITDCRAADCSGVVVGSGIATFGPAAVVLISIVFSIVRLVQRRRAFWIPIMGMGAAVLMTVLGAAIVFGTIG